jgi:hypothetical protein
MDSRFRGNDGGVVGMFPFGHGAVGAHWMIA